MAINCYITFPTIYYAIRAENLLQNGTCLFRMVPVPRSISSSCGTALRCDCQDVTVIREHLLQGGLELEGFYCVEEKGLQGLTVEELYFEN